MTIELYTFGKTPAAKFLARTINDRNLKIVTACTNRARTFNTNVNEIRRCVATGTMSAHVAANLLRLLRDEATKIEFDSSVIEGKFIAQLLRNVIIGNIKRAIRATSTLRKIEVGNVNLNKVARKGSPYNNGLEEEVVSYSILGYAAGTVTKDGQYNRQFPDYNSISDPTTPELLAERSDRRCLRQGKSHMTTQGA